jgi:hypothetical protein
LLKSNYSKIRWKNALYSELQIQPLLIFFKFYQNTSTFFQKLLSFHAWVKLYGI